MEEWKHSQISGRNDRLFTATLAILRPDRRDNRKGPQPYGKVFSQ